MLWVRPDRVADNELVLDYVGVRVHAAVVGLQVITGSASVVVSVHRCATGVLAVIAE